MTSKQFAHKFSTNYKPHGECSWCHRRKAVYQTFYGALTLIEEWLCRKCFNDSGAC